MIVKFLTLETESFAPRREVMDSYREKVACCHKKLHNDSLQMTGWVNLPNSFAPILLHDILNAGAEIRRRYTALVVIGIGGSYLGTRCCYEMLGKEQKGVKLFFAGWNMGSRYHKHLLEQLKDYDVALCVISKSGTTTETMLAFDLLKDYLKQRYGDAYTDRIYAVTDAQKGELHKETQRMGYHSFSLPSDIGGRYSVLTAVGLLPLAAAGVDIVALLYGAKQAYKETLSCSLDKNICYQYAVFRNVLFREGKSVEFFSFSEPEMFQFGYWLKQLFAESEGKNGAGIYPSALIYSTDLHSVGQFLEEGNPIFFETMLTIDSCEYEISVPNHKHSFFEHSKATSEAIYYVRNARSTPTIRFTLPSLDEKTIGNLIYFFEKACAMSCMLMNINPFDQPGVEAYKRELHRLLQTK